MVARISECKSQEDWGSSAHFRTSGYNFYIKPWRLQDAI